MLLALTSVAALLAFAGIFRFTEKEHVAGYLAPGVGWAQVTSAGYAVLRTCVVTEGDRVREGDVLCEFASSEGLEKGRAVEAQLLDEISRRRNTLTARLSAVNRGFRKEMELMSQGLGAAQTQERLFTSELEALKGRLHIARRQLEIGTILAESGSLPEADVLELRDRVESRSAETAAKERELEGVRTYLRGHEAQVDRISSTRDEKTLAIEEELQSLNMDHTRIQAGAERLLLAPRAGRIASIQVLPGASLVPGQHLMDIVPIDERMQAMLFANPSAMRKVSVGQEVRIYVDALPVERYGALSGVVRSIAETTAETKRSSSDATYKISVEIHSLHGLDAEVAAVLRPGMTVAADLVSGHSSILDWLIDPMRRGASRV